MYVYFTNGKDIEKVKNDFGDCIQFISVKTKYNKNFKKLFLERRVRSNGSEYLPKGLLFPQKINKSLKKGLEKCDKIIIGDYDPPIQVLKHMKSAKTFHIRSGTFFSNKKKERETVLNYLWNTKEKVKIVYYSSRAKYEFENIKDCWDCFRPSYS